MALQATDEERREVATCVVDNAGDLEALERQVDEIWPDLERRAASRRAGRSRESTELTVSPRRYARPMPAFELVTDLAPAGDQPEAIAALGRRARARRPVPDAAGHHRVGQELHDRRT